MKIESNYTTMDRENILAQFLSKNNRCMVCGGELETHIIGPASDYGLSDGSPEKEYDVVVYSCKRCGATIEVHLPNSMEEPTVSNDLTNIGTYID